MFNKEDYINYFNNIKKIEQKMIDNMADLKKIVTDPDMLSIIDSIYKDEHDHYNWEEEIIEFLNKYY